MRAAITSWRGNRRATTCAHARLRRHVWNLLLYFTLGLVIAQSAHGTIARAVASGLVAVPVGFSRSVRFDLPTGPAPIAVSGMLVLLAWLVRLAQGR